MSPETKARVFDTEALKKIEYAYQVFQICTVDIDSVVALGKAKPEDAVDQIKKIKDNLKEVSDGHRKYEDRMSSNAHQSKSFLPSNWIIFHL